MPLSLIIDLCCYVFGFFIWLIFLASRLCLLVVCQASSGNIFCGLHPVGGRRDDGCDVVINVAINLKISDHVKND